MEIHEDLKEQTWELKHDSFYQWRQRKLRKILRFLAGLGIQPAITVVVTVKMLPSPIVTTQQKSWWLYFTIFMNLKSGMMKKTEVH